MLQAGIYKATRIKECFIAESKEKKTPYFGLVFELENNQEVTWSVYLSETFSTEKAREMAEKNMETLALLGYKGSKLADMADDDLSIKDLFDDFYDEVAITIEMETYEKDGKVKEIPKVKWVNVGVNGGHIKLDKKQAVIKTKSLIYDGAFLKAKKALPERKKPAAPSFDNEEIPF
jgi:hypothetical protein